MYMYIHVHCIFVHIVHPDRTCNIQRKNRPHIKCTATFALVCVRWKVRVFASACVLVHFGLFFAARGRHLVHVLFYGDLSWHSHTLSVNIRLCL